MSVAKRISDFFSKPETDTGNVSAIAESVRTQEVTYDKVSNVAVYGLWESVTASKYPMATDTRDCTCEITSGVLGRGHAPSGSAHDCFLKGVTVQFDLTLSNKMLVELERYHFLDIVSSQSTMHRITKMSVDNQCNEYVDSRVRCVLTELICEYNDDPSPERYLKVLYNVPSGYELTMRVTTNYLQLKTIYHQRKDHRLPEWREFCKWVLTLPYFKMLCMRDVDIV